jgi:hypothetical protein
MSEGDALQKTLADIKMVASRFQDAWWVIGSAAAHLAGADAGAVQDVDLLLSARDARLLTAKWQDRLLPPPAPSTQFRSDPFYRFDGPLAVEAMANFEMNVRGAWRAITPETCIEIDGVPVPNVDEQIRLLRMMDRIKDQPRIKALEALL